MTFDMHELSLIGEMSDADADIFKKAVRLLLSGTFIIRGTEKNDAMWNFAVRNIKMLEAWFSCADISLKRDENLGVIALRPSFDMRIKIGKEETCALLVLRLLFEEKRTELTLSKFPSVRVFDYVQRYRAVIGLDLKKTHIADIMRKFSSLNLISFSGDPTDPEGILLLYPSIALTLDQAGIEEISAAVENAVGGNAAVNEIDTESSESDNAEVTQTELDGGDAEDGE